jgi:hypothetical protein
MADLLQLRGLVALGPRPTGTAPADGARASGRAGEVAAGRPAGAPVEADSVEVRPPVLTDVRAREMEVRQRAVTAAQAGADALERVSQRLAAVREGRENALFELRAEVQNARGLADAGPNLAELLLQVDARSAEAVDPGLVETAMVETENALAATYGVLNFERRGLSAQQIAVENQNALRVDLERLERAAERLRRQEAEGQPVELLEALRGPAISRDRVVELLIQ